MTNEEILEKAVSKAIKGGWKQPAELNFISNKEFLIYLTDSTPSNLKWIKLKLNELIFNHDFAKALWGGTVDVDADGRETMPDWQYYLQEMVIADDPIKYLGEHI